MEDDEYKYDLGWHALNYRTASSEHANEAFLELQACVGRLKEKAENDVLRSIRKVFRKKFCKRRQGT